jgi:FtsP/CotA-like multicopper oxidase with cupredoxin domain
MFPRNTRLGAVALLALSASTAFAQVDTPRAPALPDVAINDNRMPAGTLSGGVLTLTLRAAEGLWRPEAHEGPGLPIQALGEGASPLTIPSPLIRVVEGTAIAATIRNELDKPMRVHGLCERGAAACAPIDVPPRESRAVRFASGPAGTYHYWATTSGSPLQVRAVGDTQLSGAFIVDPPDAQPSDRIFIVTDWTNLTMEQLEKLTSATDIGKAFMQLNPKFTFLMNGLSWPHTERLTYHLGETVRWRIINLSTQAHTMHLHGFYYQVDGTGDGLRSKTFTPDDRQRVVTQLMPPGGTLAMTWTPERVGNWLYHCHIRAHVSPELRLGGAPAGHDHNGHDGSAGMAGMILGVTVTGASQTEAPAGAATHERKITLVMQSDAKRYGDAPAFGFVLADANGTPSATRVPVPGPTLVLKRGEPVAITLINRLPEGTAIHWHGMELDSYYDGVHGWSGVGQRVTPLIEPGGSFVVRFTPPRAGTFMYHTHLHDNRQLTAGLYGAMLVLDEGETFETTDHVFVMGRSGPGDAAPAVLNGEREPQVVWKAGTRHRIRLINITPSDLFSVSLQTNEGPVTWRPLTKDGAPLPPSRCQPTAAKLTIGVGETYDFEYVAPEGRRNLWLEVRSPAGKWQTQGHVIVK